MHSYINPEPTTRMLPLVLKLPEYSSIGKSPAGVNLHHAWHILDIQEVSVEYMSGLEKRWLTNYSLREIQK